MNDFVDEVRATLHEQAAGIDRGAAFSVREARMHRYISRRRRLRTVLIPSLAASCAVVAVAIGVTWSNDGNSRSPSGAGNSSATASFDTSEPTSYCASERVTAVVNGKSTDLADCAGLVGLSQAPVIELSVGQSLDVLGLPAGAVLLPSDEGIVNISGDTVYGVSPGSVFLRVDAAFCAPISVSNGGCRVAEIDVS